MKIRTGFVSNSSSSSFYIYGWSCKTHDEKKVLWDKLVTFKPSLEGGLTCSYTPDGDYVVGVGNTDDEMDHYMDDWEDYECDGPTTSQCEALDEVGKKLGLPPAETRSATWYNG